jgi:hypothetical protein
VPVEDACDVNLNIVEGDQISHVENDILLHLCLHRRLGGVNIIDEGKD